MCRKFWTKIIKKIFFFRKIFFLSSKKLTFEKENVIFFNTFLSFNLFYLILLSFFVNFVHMNDQNFKYFRR